MCTRISDRQFSFVIFSYHECLGLLIRRLLSALFIYLLIHTISVFNHVTHSSGLCRHWIPSRGPIKSDGLWGQISRERKSRKPVVSARLDDILYIYIYIYEKNKVFKGRIYLLLNILSKNVCCCLFYFVLCLVFVWFCFVLRLNDHQCLYVVLCLLNYIQFLKWN